MRTLLLPVLAVLTLFGLSSVAQAQPRKVTIERVRVGLPVNQVQGEFKSGFWMPVYVDVTAGPEGLPRGGEVAIEAADCDDVRNNYHVLLPVMEPNERVAVMGYTKPSSVHSEIVTTVRVDNRNWYHREHYNSMQPGEVLLTTIGSRLPGLRRAYLPTAKEEEEQFQRDTGPHRFAFIDDVRELPNRWFGYDACDIIFLTTGNRDFISALLSERDGRKEAILEWVRKGGRLVISAGKNQDVLANLDTNFGSFLPISIAGTQQVPRLPLGRFGDPKTPDLLFPPGKVGQDGKPLQLELAKLTPKEGREFERLLPEETRADAPIYIARGAYGLGQVIVVAFDLDLPPFTSFGGQARFWESFNSRIIKMPEKSTNPQQQRVGFPGNNNETDVASQLQQKLEDFPDVPVVSFGWVALFILIYIIIVGPVDYFFLKKVVKRLELTWITFPTVVIVISVASYFIAYYLKGNDQLINKIDLVDIDQVGNQMYGHTWFTIFSPRIQHYTVGVEPAEGWVAPSPELRKGETVLVSWMGRPEMGFGGVNRASSQSLFRRSYDYMPDATGMRGVPIQVWTTKSFMSEWQTPIDPKRQPFKADLSEPVGAGDAVARLTGTITSNLPVELEDVHLLYRNNAYNLERLDPKNPKRVDNLFNKGEAPTVSTWLNNTPKDSLQEQVTASRPGAGPRNTESSYATIKRIEFFRADTNTTNRTGPNQVRDSLLYNLDQSWRLGQKQGVILVGRVPRKQGPAETITRDALSASQLWLGQLPPSGLPRPEIPGSLNQETYVRVFLPIKTGGDAAR